MRETAETNGIVGEHRIRKLKLSHSFDLLFTKLIIELGALEVLHLRYSKIEELPSWIGTMVNMKEFTLSYTTRLTTLPNQIGNMTKLKSLDLPVSIISSLPSSVGRLKNPKELNLSFTTRLTTLPDEIGDMTKLESLDLINSSISSLPSSVGRLKNLKELNLSNTTRLTTLPNEIGDMTKLESLDLSTSSISSIPNSIGRVENLKKLNLSKTNISSLPNAVGKLKDLKELDLSSTTMLTCGLPLRVLNLTKSAVVDSKGENNALLLNIVKQCHLLGCVGRSGGYRLRGDSNPSLVYNLSINRARSRVVFSDETAISFPLGLWKLILHNAEAASKCDPCAAMGANNTPYWKSQLPQSDAMFRLLVERGAKEIWTKQ